MSELKFTICCICGERFRGWGNNPCGAAWTNEDGEVEFFESDNEDDRCCDECNQRYVIPGRMYKLGLNKK